MGDISSDAEHFLHISQVFKIGTACQILLEFIKDGPLDLGDQFAYGGSANQSVILQGCVGFSCCQESVIFPVSILLLRAS